jgi:hypothetical protein
MFWVDRDVLREFKTKHDNPHRAMNDVLREHLGLAPLPMIITPNQREMLSVIMDKTLTSRELIELMRDRRRYLGSGNLDRRVRRDLMLLVKGGHMEEVGKVGVEKLWRQANRPRVVYK